LCEVINYNYKYRHSEQTTRRSTLGDRAFVVAGPRAWNSLPDAIRHNPSLAVFKRLLRTHFFTQSFY